MAYYPDLTPYEYYWRGPHHALNVGWLDPQHPFEMGPTSVEFRQKLLLFCLDKYLVCLYRGYHQCEFCEMTEREWAAGSQTRYGKGAELAAIGCGEIRVSGKGVVYAAPALISHYVGTHNYRPPEGFITAVLNGPGPGSREHLALLELWGT